jgi:hypothetical protein
MNSGQVFFNTVDSYAFSNEPERGDSNEGAISIENTQFKSIRAVHPILGTFNFKPQKNTLGKITQYDFSYLSHSLYAITSDVFSESDIFQISEKMKEFGEYALMIKEPYIFLNAITAELKKNNIKYEINSIDYQDLSKESKFKITPFIKDSKFSHQNELRIIVENKNDRAESINIGSITNYTLELRSQTMLEMIWEANS